MEHEIPHRKNRGQIPLFVGCLGEAIEADNEVRLIDAFVEALPLGDFGFKVDHLENGRPAYHPVLPACPLRPLS